MRKIKTKTPATRKERSTPFLIKALKESEADRKAGRVKSFKNVDDAISHFENLTKKSTNESKKRT